MKQAFSIIFLLIGLVVLAPAVSSAFAKTYVTVGGDIDVNRGGLQVYDTISDIDNCYVGVGDYFYNKSTVGTAKYWRDNLMSLIDCKNGALGNHDTAGFEGANKEVESIVRKTLHMNSDGWSSKRIGNSLFVFISTFAKKYDSNSDQYKNTVNELKKCQADDGCKHAYIVTHEPTLTPNVGSGHPANGNLAKLYKPLAKIYTKIHGFISGHNHVWAYKSVAKGLQGAFDLLCGHGGRGGDSIKGLNGFKAAGTGPQGVCVLKSSDVRVDLDLIDKNGHVFKSARLWGG